MDTFPARLALQQRVLPAYRAPFFDALAAVCRDGLTIFAGLPLPEEHIATTDFLQVATYVRARNRHLFNPGSPFYQCWQSGLVRWRQPVSRPRSFGAPNPQPITALPCSCIQRMARGVFG